MTPLPRQHLPLGATGPSIHSTRYEVDARQRVLWASRGRHHRWTRGTFTEDGDGVLVRTQESWAGGPDDADWGILDTAPDDSRVTWLDALETAAEQELSTETTS
ncbi:hypothetical protein [Streptomyces sp. C10-9-1]|uniref:hypothetical protein n=1 Tax=Streptomyces sp. C10-9-1 TaxID=1859285 RepID=UPI003D74AE82